MYAYMYTCCMYIYVPSKLDVQLIQSHIPSGRDISSLCQGLTVHITLPLGLCTHAYMYVCTHVVYVCVNHHGDEDRELSMYSFTFTQLQ